MSKIALFIDSYDISKQELNSVLIELSQFGEILFINHYLPEYSKNILAGVDYKITDTIYELIIIDLMKALSTTKINSFAILSNLTDYNNLFKNLYEQQSFFISNNNTLLSNKFSINFDLKNYLNYESVGFSKKDIKINTMKDFIVYYKKTYSNNELVPIHKVLDFFKQTPLQNVLQIIKSTGDFIILKQPDGYYIKLDEQHNISDLLADDKFRFLMISSFDQLNKKQGVVYLNIYHNLLSTKHNFNYNKYGFDNFIDFINSLNIFNIDYNNNSISLS